MWAPNAQVVELVVEPDGPGTPRESVPMSAEPGGWWRVDAHAALTAGPDARYGFSVDGGPARPDPRSVRQPEGVHELSALFTVDDSFWHDGDWAGRDVRGSVVYELHLGTFTPDGTLDSAIERLDHLVGLGVDFVELMPVNAFNGVHNWGYDGVDWYAVQETYGGPAALARFVDACHGKGLGVVLDVVYNHLGPSGNYLPDFGPYLSQGVTSWGSSVNLSDPDSDEVRAFITGTALRWFTEFHVDALRLDAVHALVDHRAVHILEELAAATDSLSAQLGRPLSLIAESDLNDPRMILPRTVNGLGLTAQWDDDIHHAIHTLVSGERQGYYGDFGSFECLAKVLTGASSTTAPIRRSGVGATAGRFRPTSSPRRRCWRTPATTTRSAIARSATGRAPISTADSSPSRPHWSCCPLHPHAVHGRGMGRGDAVPVLHLPPGTGAGPRDGGGTQVRVRRTRLGQ